MASLRAGGICNFCGRAAVILVVAFHRQQQDFDQEIHRRKKGGSHHRPYSVSSSLVPAVRRMAGTFFCGRLVYLVKRAYHRIYTGAADAGGLSDAPVLRAVLAGNLNVCDCARVVPRADAMKRQTARG